MDTMTSTTLINPATLWEPDQRGNPILDDRRIRHRYADQLTPDDTRTIVRVMNSGRESLWTELGLQAVLDLHHAARDRGWDGWVSFADDAPRAAQAMYATIAADDRRRRRERGDR